MVKITTKAKNIFTQTIGEEKESQIDEAVLSYIFNVLDAQTKPETQVDENEVLGILSLFLWEYRVCSSPKDAEELSSAIINKMKEEGVIKENTGPTGVVLLKDAVNLGKSYDETVIRTNYYASTAIVNTNDEIDWDERKNAAKLERKLKKEQKARQAELQKYEEYLKMRGLSKAKGIIKIHNADYFSGPRDIHCENFSITMGNNHLLESTSLHLAYGRRYGLVGRNGAGKTTLLRHMADREIEGLPPYLQILHIEQEVIGDDATALECVLNTDVERLQLLAEEKKLLESNDDNSARRLAEIYQRMEEIDAHSAESRASSILAGLGFTPEMQAMATKKFSGGWRMRIALARALFISPDVLLLDEPTNHLDLHAVLWLENYLLNWDKTLVIVSHARNFLNSVCTDIIHLHGKKLEQYKGDYDTFERVRTEKLKNQQKTYEAQQLQKKHIQSFIDRFRYKAATAKMAQSRIKMLEKIEFVAAVAEDPTFAFKFPSPEPVNPPFLQAVDCSFGYNPKKLLFKDLNFNLDMDSRIALVGDNGAGKSTFMNVLSGELEPVEGVVIRNGKIRIAKFSQHHVDQLNLQQTPLEYMCSRFPGHDPQVLRSHLGSLGLSGDLAVQPIYTLSGGQKSRIAFAVLTFTKPHLLLLDEPTNHLDIDTVQALIQAINEYEGGVLIVSHDEYLISSVCDEIWVCGNGQITKWDGDFADYRKSLKIRV